MTTKRSRWAVTFLGSLTGAFAFSVPESALACGGFFCSATQPVNQAAERIIFADNGDQTVTAVIQIMYEGPAENFSWLLPISTVPGEGDIGVASDIAFQRLQNFTNPQYNLTLRVEGQCQQSDDRFVGGAQPGSSPNSPTVGAEGPDDGSGGVTVEASGVVGAFEWTVISVDPSLPRPADAAVLWLEDNDYDVGEGADGLLGPYLMDGLNLLALKLVKGADTGSIRPIMLTYDAERPMIPIKLTAVAANEDMGVMTWVLSSARSVPLNYHALELNEARINWFNAAANYNDVVVAAANEAGGQGFVTEFAGPSSSLSQAVWSTSDDAQWETFRTGIYTSLDQLLLYANGVYGGWDGFWDAVEETVTLPDGVTFDDFRSCPSCYADGIQLSPSEFMNALETHVLDPVRAVQELLNGRDYVTRLYSTLSAMEMTVDPLFGFNPDLADLNNIHSAERIIECNPDVSEFEAPWRIELPGGGVVRGTGQSVGTWPTAVDDQPSNVRITTLTEAGPGRVLEDNTAQIDSDLAEHNRTVPSGHQSSDGCALGTPASAGGGLAALVSLLGLAMLRRRRRAT